MRVALLATGAAFALAGWTGPALADEASSLKAQIEALQERIAKVEADKSDKRRVAAAAAVEAGDKPRSWKLPGTNTSMNIGGFARLQVIWDVGGGGSSAGSLDATFLSGGFNEGCSSTNVIGCSVGDNQFNGGNWRLHARESRFWIQTWTPTDWGELRTYIETDFFGAGNVLRLRHAYGTLGPVLAGQTWSTFMPVFAFPESLDFGGPLVPSISRRAQLRYTHNFGGGFTMEAAIEDPLGDVLAAASCTPAVIAAGGACAVLGAGAFANGQRWPDFVLNASYSFQGGRVFVAGIVKEISADNGCAVAGCGLSQNDRGFGWGITVAGIYAITPRIEVGGGLWIGEGILGRYFSGQVTVTDALFVTNPTAPNGDLRAVFGYGGWVWAQVKVTDTIRVNGMYAYGYFDHEDEIPGVSKGARKIGIAGLHEYAWYAIGNVIWSPVPQVSFGIEYNYQFGGRYHSANGYISRVQGMAVYRF
jgi:hypothetical protein